MSPYITHGLITLRDVLERVNHKTALGQRLERTRRIERTFTRAGHGRVEAKGHEEVVPDERSGFTRQGLGFRVRVRHDDLAAHRHALAKLHIAARLLRSLHASLEMTLHHIRMGHDRDRHDAPLHTPGDGTLRGREGHEQIRDLLVVGGRRDTDLGDLVIVVDAGAVFARDFGRQPFDGLARNLPVLAFVAEDILLPRGADDVEVLFKQ